MTIRIHDNLGLLGSDKVTTFGTGVDTTVARLTYAYDSAGRISHFTSRDSSDVILNRVERLYNGFGQLTEERQEHDGDVDGSTPSVQYSYSEDTTNNHSRLESMTYPNGRVVHYLYDGVNPLTGDLDDRISRLSQVSDDASGTLNLEAFEYLGFGTPIRQERGDLDSAVVLTRDTPATFAADDPGDRYGGLDRFGRIGIQRWQHEAGTGFVLITDLDTRYHAYDENGNRLNSLINFGLSDKSEFYTYDGLNRLGNFERGVSNTAGDGVDGTPVRSQLWDLDVLGNWKSITNDGGTAQTRTHDDQNRLLTAGGTSLAYSPNGEMITDENGNELIYDGWGRLVSWDDPATTSSTEVTYTYDALYRRIERSENGAAADHWYYSSRWQVLEERDATGTATTQYVWSPVYVDAMIVRDVDQNGDGDTTDTGDQRLYALHDANFNITAITNETGIVQERYLYDPYGTRTVLDANWATDADGVSDVGWQHGHQGGRHDAITNLAHFRFRDLDAELGRWSRQDPLGYVDGSMLYTFTQENPLVRVDPEGLRWYRGWWEGAKALVGMADPEVQEAFDASNWDRSHGTADALVEEATMGIVDNVGGTTIDEDNRSGAASAAGTITTTLSNATGAGAVKNLGQGGIRRAVANADTPRGTPDAPTPPPGGRGGPTSGTRRTPAGNLSDDDMDTVNDGFVMSSVGSGRKSPDGEIKHMDYEVATNEGMLSKGFTEKHYFQDEGGNWWSAHRNPDTGEFDGYKPSSRTD